jgi:hypothetical protein
MLIKETLMKESDICKHFYRSVVDLQNYKQFSFDFVILHVANEQMSSMRYTKHLMRMGMMPGAPDYLILYEGGWAAIEFKRTSKGKQTANQKNFEIKCVNLGARYLLTSESQVAIEFLHSLQP